MIPPGIWFLLFPLFLHATHVLFRLGLKHTVSIKDLGFLNGDYCVSNSVCLGLSVKMKFFGEVVRSWLQWACLGCNGLVWIFDYLPN
jgi:hypothetical protein